MKLLRSFDDYEKNEHNPLLCIYDYEEDYGISKKVFSYRDRDKYTLGPTEEVAILSTLHYMDDYKHMVFLDTVAKPDKKDLETLMNEYLFCNDAEIYKTKNGYHVYMNGEVHSIKRLTRALLSLPNIRYWLDFQWLGFCLDRGYLTLRITDNTNKGPINYMESIGSVKGDWI